jgi:hypothetical protein
MPCEFEDVDASCHVPETEERCSSGVRVEEFDSL